MFARACYDGWSALGNRNDRGRLFTTRRLSMREGPLLKMAHINSIEVRYIWFQNLPLTFIQLQIGCLIKSSSEFDLHWPELN